MSICNDVTFPSFFSILTADVRYCKKLSANEKILFSEISALSNIKGYCTASNNYFSNLYDVNIRTIQRWISNLVENGFIKITNTNNTRHIYIILNSDNKLNNRHNNKKKNKKIVSEPNWLKEYIENFEKDVISL